MWHFLSWAVEQCGIIDPSIGTERWSLSASGINGLEGVADTKTPGLNDIKETGQLLDPKPGRKIPQFGRECNC